MQRNCSKLNNDQFSTSQAYIEDHEIEDALQSMNIEILSPINDITLEQISSMENYHQICSPYRTQSNSEKKTTELFTMDKLKCARYVICKIICLLFAIQVRLL